MYLQTLTIVNFKNIREAVIGFSPKLNTFIGNNGAGKTNLLDALYSLSFTKSFFSASDQMNIYHHEAFFMLQGRYSRDDGEENVVYGFQSGQKKQLKRNGKVYRKLSDHIGLLPLVMVSPSDSSLILGGSDERRKFIDGVISQYSPGYLDDLLRYNRVLLQRNNLLKLCPSGTRFDGDMLDIYNCEMIESGQRLHLQRRDFISELIPVFQHYYTCISGGNEEVGLRYHSDLDDLPFDQLLRQTLAHDRLLQFTTAGIHKDDLLFSLGGHLLKKLGSQGQQKTYLIALKLAQFEFIFKISGVKPILLLDDIFDKLDKTRVEQIVEMVAGEMFGQIFITDTNRDHLDSILQSVTNDYRIFMVSKGQIEQVR
jgi:DNA replication and repair protein RecF